MRRVFEYGAKPFLVLFLFIDLTVFAAAPSDADAEACFRKAATLAQQGKIEDAEREYAAGLRIAPQSAAAYNNLGTLYFQQRQFSRAAGAFRSARRLLPGDAEIAFNLGLALYKLGDSQSAIPQLIEGQRSSHALDANLLLGICDFETRQWKDSIDVLEEYRKHAPDNPQVLFMLQQSYVHSGDAKSSLNSAAELLKSYPNSPYTHQMLGEAYDRDGDFDHAIEEFRLAIEGNPNAPQLHFMLGYIYWRWKRYAEAVSPLEEETRMNPGFAQSYFYLGDIAFRTKQTDRALKLFRKTLDLDPSYREANIGLGKCYLQAGRSAEAIAALRKAEAGTENTAEVHYLLGRALILQGRKEEGEKELGKVRDFNANQQQKMQQKLNGVPLEERLQSPVSR